MGSLKVYATVAGFLAVATSITTARAADLLPPPPPPMPSIEPIGDDFGGGWYLRGDVGVSKYDGSKFKNAEFPSAVYFGEDFGSGSFAGGGIGYRFNSWFRADITGEYRFSTGIKVRDRDSFSSGGFLITSHEKTKGDYDAAVFLANGYIDVGTWYGVTPFIGGGVGYAYHWLNNFETSTLNVYNSPAIPVGVSGGTIRDKDKGSFAWALHAGLAYDVTSNVKLELAYRYMNFGNLRTGQIDCFCGVVYQGLKVKDLESHDVKLGMRWALGGETAVPAYEPAPLMRKY